MYQVSLKSEGGRPFFVITWPGITHTPLSLESMQAESIGSTTSKQRLCDLSSAGKFGRGKAEAKLSQGG